MEESFTPEYDKSFQVIESNMKLDDERYLAHRQEWDHHTKTLELKDVPLHVDIEATNACNLRCSMCERNSMKRKVGLMEMDMFTDIIDQCVEMGVCSVKLNLWGESLVHPKIFKMIEYARENKIYTQFNTNANFLTPDAVKNLVASGLDRITISVESIDKGMYEQTRVGNKFDKVFQNIENLIESKPIGQKPYVTMQCLRMKRNLHLVDDFIERYTGRVDYISVTNLESLTGEEHILKESLIDYSVMPQQPCAQLWQRLSVYWNGDITVCCADSDGYLTIGNIKDRSLREWWNSKELNTLREKHMKLDFCGLICQKCTNTRKIVAEKIKPMEEEAIANWGK